MEVEDVMAVVVRLHERARREAVDNFGRLATGEVSWAQLNRRDLELAEKREACTELLEELSRTIVDETEGAWTGAGSSGRFRVYTSGRDRSAGVSPSRV